MIINYNYLRHNIQILLKEMVIKMRKLNKKLIHLNSIGFLLIISLSSMIIFLPLNSMNSEIVDININKDTKNDLNNPLNTIISSSELIITSFFKTLKTASDSDTDLYIINESLYHIPKTLWVRQAYNFTFEYPNTSAIPPENLGELDQAYYQWYEVSANGSIISNISNKTDLIEVQNTTYILDFNTVLRDVGDYVIFVTLYKENYDVRIVLIDLTIQKRKMTLNLTATNLIQNQIRIEQGNPILFELALTDLTEPANPQPITDATIFLTIGLEQYSLTGTNGTYKYTFKTSEINTFFTIQVYTGEISIAREDYVPESISITIVVEMIEIFPGLPLFYFIMIVSSVAAIIGSLVAYRIIQLSRISAFVKKARKMKKVIKGKKTISESLLFPSKDDYIVKQLGDKWDMLGLSLQKILGIEKIKKKKLPETRVKLKEEKMPKKSSESSGGIDESKGGES